MAIYILLLLIVVAIGATVTHSRINDPTSLGMSVLRSTLSDLGLPKAAETVENDWVDFELRDKDKGDRRYILTYYEQEDNFKDVLSAFDDKR